MAWVGRLDGQDEEGRERLEGWVGGGGRAGRDWDNGIIRDLGSPAVHWSISYKRTTEWVGTCGDSQQGTDCERLSLGWVVRALERGV